MKASSLSPKIIVLLTALIVGTVSGCTWFSPYKQDIPQGQIITHQMVNKLRPGMTQRQVIYVLGTPLLKDFFHKDRWDYLYQNRPASTKGLVITHRLTVFFKKGMLHHFENDFPKDIVNVS